MIKDYYEILGVPLDADFREITKAYRKLALKYHPDQNNSPDAHDRFIEITEAYEVLRDRSKRAQYDDQYKKAFGQRSAKETEETSVEFQSKAREWKEYGEKKAQEYSGMEVEEFMKMLLREINIGANYIPNAIAIIVTLLIGVSTLVLIPFAEPNNGFMVLLLLGISFGFFYVAYRLFLVAQKDYQEERKRKNL